METYYRFHQADAPAFTAANAWSALWGSTFNADGSQTECHRCDGTGEDNCEPCPTCDGTGWEDCAPGYSCCDTAAELIAYMDAHAGHLGDDTGLIYEFTGRRVGDGFDGEPLVVPAAIVRTLTWSQLRAEVTA